MKALILTAAALAALPSAANAATLVVNVAGSQSFVGFGLPGGNTVATYNIGANSRVTGVAYSVNITAFDPSYLSEAAVGFTDSASLNGVNLTPGFAVNASGTQSFSGSADLVSLGLDFAVGADGVLRLEYFETFNDAAVSPDARWNSGTITFTYDTVGGAIPEPSAWALLILGFGSVGTAMRRRQQAVRVSFA